MKVTSWSFYIGQGTSNLIEVEVNGTKHHILIDSGTSGSATTQPRQSAYEKIYELTNGVFDLIIISHTDEDHLNEIYRMILDNKITDVERVLIGGAPKNILSLQAIIKRKGVPDNNSRFSLLLNALVSFNICEQEKINFLTGGDYSKTILSFQETSTGEECNFRMLACRNCIELNRNKFINANSAVVVCENKLGNCVANICYGGDATVETFAFINEKIKEARNRNDSPYRNLVGNKNNILITPHHGAIRTSCRSERMAANMNLNNALLEANEFADNIAAKCIFTSAYYKTRHNWHPCINILDVYAKAAGHTGGHTIAAYQLYLTQDGRTQTGLERDYACMQETRENYTSFSFSKAFSGKCKVSGTIVQYGWIDQEINNRAMEEKLYDFMCVMSRGRLSEYGIVDA